MATLVNLVLTAHQESQAIWGQRAFVGKTDYLDRRANKVRLA